MSKSMILPHQRGRFPIALNQRYLLIILLSLISCHSIPGNGGLQIEDESSILSKSLKITLPLPNSYLYFYKDNQNIFRGRVQGQATSLGLGEEIYLWVSPSPNRWYVQKTPNGAFFNYVDSTWQGVIQLGNERYPPSQRRLFDLAATIVNDSIRQVIYTRSQRMKEFFSSKPLGNYVSEIRDIMVSFSPVHIYEDVSPYKNLNKSLPDFAYSPNQFCGVSSSGSTHIFEYRCGTPSSGGYRTTLDWYIGDITDRWANPGGHGIQLVKPLGDGRYPHKLKSIQNYLFSLIQGNTNQVIDKHTQIQINQLTQLIFELSKSYPVIRHDSSSMVLYLQKKPSVELSLKSSHSSQVKVYYMLNSFWEEGGPGFEKLMSSGVYKYDEVKAEKKLAMLNVIEMIPVSERNFKAEIPFSQGDSVIYYMFQATSDEGRSINLGKTESEVFEFILQ